MFKVVSKAHLQGFPWNYRWNHAAAPSSRFVKFMKIPGHKHYLCRLGHSRDMGINSRTVPAIPGHLATMQNNNGIDVISIAVKVEEVNIPPKKELDMTN